MELWYEEVWNREKERRVDLRIERRSETKRTKEKEELMIVIGDEIMHRELLLAKIKGLIKEHDNKR